MLPRPADPQIKHNPRFHEGLEKILDQHNAHGLYVRLMRKLDKIFNQENSIDFLITSLSRRTYQNAHDTEVSCLHTLMTAYAKRHDISIYQAFAPSNPNGPEIREAAQLCAEVLHFLREIGAILLY